MKEKKRTGGLLYWLLPLGLLLPVIAAGVYVWVIYGGHLTELLQTALKAGLIP